MYLSETTFSHVSETLECVYDTRKGHVTVPLCGSGGVVLIAAA